MVVSPGGAIATRPTTPGLATMESASMRRSSHRCTAHYTRVQCDGELSSSGEHTCTKTGEKVERCIVRAWYHMPPPANGGSEGEIESAAGHLDDPPPCSWIRFLTSTQKLVCGNLEDTWTDEVPTSLSVVLILDVSSAVKFWHHFKSYS